MFTAVKFIEELPKIEIKDGIAHVETFSGGMSIKSALSIHQFIRNVAVCNEAIAEWESRKPCEIVQLPIAEPKFERVYGKH